ncbi:hypothetical protein BDV24DRAFT_170595 [Aspergillus arachidicola]|uniref:Uncharacterized protein n=1 Tax=Aspergillus arachidicola TaxID=656916 RepID=A0A5N6XLF4_9EURO|nr:hypothetical protein BDV24DRAFT_170595 [Aspergillus arachidicola]
MDEHSWEKIKHLPPSDSRPYYPTDDSVDTIDPTGKGYAGATDPLPKEFDQHADELLKAYEASRQTSPQQGNVPLTMCTRGNPHKPCNVASSCLGSENGGPKAPVTDPNTAASPADTESAMNLLTGPTRESFNNLMGQSSDRPSQAQTSNDMNVGTGQSFNEGKYVPGVDGFDSSGNPIFGDQGKYDAAVWG